jgi:hypothetical protein
MGHQAEIRTDRERADKRCSNEASFKRLKPFRSDITAAQSSLPGFLITQGLQISNYTQSPTCCFTYFHFSKTGSLQKKRNRTPVSSQTGLTLVSREYHCHFTLLGAWHDRETLIHSLLSILTFTFRRDSTREKRPNTFHVTDNK